MRFWKKDNIESWQFENTTELYVSNGATSEYPATIAWH